MWSLLLNKYVLGGLAIALIIGGLAWAHSNYVDKLVDKAVMAERGKWQSAIDKQKAEAATILAKLTQEAAQKEKAYSDHVIQLETDYGKKLNASKQRLATERLTHGKLLDSARKGGGCSGTSTQGETPPKAGLVERPAEDKSLSPELSELFWDSLAAGDETIIQYERLQNYANVTYDTCQGVTQ